MTNVITSLNTPTQATTKTPPPPYNFGSKEYKEVKGTLLKDQPLNPDAEIKLFNKVVKDRGYDFFSSQSLEDWKRVFGHFDNLDMLQFAILDTKLFMNSVRNPSAPDHDKNRLIFKTFDSNEEKVKEYFLAKNKAENGFDNIPFRDTSYESRILNVGAITSKHAGFEFQTFRNLILAKWAAIGYYKDIEYKQKFLDDYSIALK